MKKVAIALYVVSVLLVSGLARASEVTLADVAQAQYQSPVQIEQVSLTGSALNLIINGTLPNPCYGQPAVTMTQDDKNYGTLVIHLSAPIPTGTCIWKVKHVASEINVAFLAQASQIQVNKKSDYKVVVDGSDFSVQVHGSDLM